jgi:hypothetical protein
MFVLGGCRERWALVTIAEEICRDSFMVSRYCEREAGAKSDIHGMMTASWEL